MESKLVPTTRNVGEINLSSLDVLESVVNLAECVDRMELAVVRDKLLVALMRVKESQKCKIRHKLALIFKAVG
jgi:hypothetical protein